MNNVSEIDLLKNTRLTKKRWLIMALYCTIVFLHTCIVVMLSPLAVHFEKVYQAGPSVVNINAILSLFIYFPANFLMSNFIFEKFGVHKTLIFGCILDSTCLWIRSLINVNFYLAMIGGLFCGLAQPLIMNANAEIASNWFDSHEVFLLFYLKKAHYCCYECWSIKYRGRSIWIYICLIFRKGKRRG